MPSAPQSFSRRFFLAFIRGYQYLISPWFPQSCRFYPTCSQYSHDAIQEWGLLKGSWLSITRIAKCHPFHAGGVDLVPTSPQCPTCQPSTPKQ